MGSRTTIKSFLELVRQQLYRHDARRGVTYAVGATLALALALPAIGLMFGSSRATAFAGLGIGGLAFALAVIGAIILGWVVPRRRFGRDHDLAREIGVRHPAIASDLLSAVELADDAPSRPGAPSSELVLALVQSIEHRLASIDPKSLVPDRALRRTLRGVLAIGLVHALTIAVIPHVLARGWRDLLSAPSSIADGATLSAVPLVGDLEATLVFPAYAKRAPLDLPSSSGDVRGLAGTNVTLRARMLVPARAVVLEIDRATNEPPEIVHATLDKLDSGAVTAAFTIEHTTKYRFVVTTPDEGRSVEATPRTIELEPDQPPVVQLIVPSEPLDVTNLRRVELAYVLEDDFGLVTAELVWESGKDRGKKPLTIGAPGVTRAQVKELWDIAEVPSGGEVRYWVEAKDNQIPTPNVGKSREFHLKVVSPRERHEETLGRQQELAEKLVKHLGGRLVLAEDQAPREELMKNLREAIGLLGTIGAAYEKDPHASDALRKALSTMRDRLDKLATIEQKLTPKIRTSATRGTYAGIDPKLVAELEDDVLVLADWLDRERLEGLLDVSDEITAHQKRLRDLLAEYARTKDPRVLDEIEREMRALDRAFAELDKHRKGLAEDVLDQYVHHDAARAQTGTSCIDEVRRLVRAGNAKEAQAKLETCQQDHERSIASLDGSLAALRGDKFTDEQKKLDEVMNELADVTKDQDDIAAEANRIFEAYAEKADEVSRDHRREASKKVTALVEKLQKKLKEIPENGLTPFAKEELDIVERRLADVEHMVADGDLAEALGMAHQAKQSLDTIAGELEAAIDDDPKSKWADATQEALDDVEKARPIAKELIDLLQSLSPRPDQIMSADDQRALERLRRREAMNKDRAKKLAERTSQLGSELPGDTGPELGKKLGGAIDQMGAADDRMKAKDPSGARESTRAAAESLAKARDRARSAARQAQEGAVGDEPIKIPGADEYRAPERFR
ncbi:MAG: hypothetical protein NT062_34110, partial [Proteobacteria bacterium]|nr:hypothetical protein [Pseudomonadota bacterium]